ncbi:MAG: coproporphyrinogen III oxidase family protein [Bacteroidales bacterium]|nr:coproporphyrinogen III oxidase family protein [Bacteroidales bacterium]
MIYLHVPFCRSFCTYCGFHSRICSGAESPQVQNFIRSVCAEAAARRAEIAAARAASVHTLYLGGGTPSLLSLDQLAAIVDAVTAVCRGEGQFAMPERRRGAKESLFEEFTMEVNPDDIVAGGVGYVRGLRALGVNRISMGVQSWDDGILRWMNRRHDAAGARRAYEILREGGVENSSLDLIFGLSQLSDVAWAETLRQTVALRPEHISAYQLSVDPDSALDALVRAGRYREVSDAAAARQYAMLCEALAAAGYIHYEVSNFALPGREAVHNSAYWRRLPYVGLGPAAHSFDGLRRTWNAAAPDWNAPDSAPAGHNSARNVSSAPDSAPAGHNSAQNVSSAPDSAPAGSVVDAEAGETPQRGKRHFAGGSETLTAAEAREEAIMLGLRTAAGIPAALLSAPSGASAASAAGSTGSAFVLAPAAERLLSEGALVRLPGGRLRIPESRWFVSDDIISSLL